MSHATDKTQRVLDDPHYAELKCYVIAATGLAYYGQKDQELTWHLDRRFDDSGARDCRAYLDLLDGDAGSKELDALIMHLTVGETSFFRHAEQFDALRTIAIPDLLDRKRRERRLRVWSAGCATGAEAYSLAILLYRDFGPRLADWDISIVGTDINRAFLAQAQSGEFGDWAFRSSPDELRAACFEQIGKLWSIRPECRRGVSFQYHNLVRHPFPSLVNNLFAFDLILCRNVMIYFDAETMRRTIGQLHESLADGGWLAVGHSEPNIEYFRQFRTVNTPDAVLYQQRGTPSADMERRTTIGPKTVVNPPWTWRRATREALPSRASNGTTTSPSAAAKTDDTPAKLTIADLRHLADHGKWNEALHACEELLAADRLDPQFYLYDALISEQLGLRQRCEQSLRQAIYVDRKFTLAHYHLGLLLQMNREFASAQQSFRNVLRLLETTPSDSMVAADDALTAGELTQMAAMHLDAMESNDDFTLSQGGVP